MKKQIAEALYHGQLIYVHFPFEDNKFGSKSRPAYLLSHIERNKVLALKITTHNKRSMFDYEIKGWHKAGLKHSSVVRCDKCAEIEYNKIEKVIGVMPRQEIQLIDTLYQKYCEEKEIQIDDDFDL